MSCGSSFGTYDMRRLQKAFDDRRIITHNKAMPGLLTETSSTADRHQKPNPRASPGSLSLLLLILRHTHFLELVEVQVCDDANL